MRKKITISDVTILVSGLVLLVASFLTWVKAEADPAALGPLGPQLQRLGIGDLSETENAWDHFPGFAYPAIAGIVAALLVVLEVTARIGDGLAGFSLTQIHLLLGAWAFVSALAIALEDLDPGIPFIDVSKGIGLWLSLAFSLVLLAGAIIRSQERAAAPTAEAMPA